MSLYTRETAHDINIDSGVSDGISPFVVVRGPGYSHKDTQCNFGPALACWMLAREKVGDTSDAEVEEGFLNLAGNMFLIPDALAPSLCSVHGDTSNVFSPWSHGALPPTLVW